METAAFSSSRRYGDRMTRSDTSIDSFVNHTFPLFCREILGLRSSAREYVLAAGDRRARNVREPLDTSSRIPSAASTATDRRRAVAGPYRAVITSSRVCTRVAAMDRQWAAHASSSRGPLRNARSSGCAWSRKNRGINEGHRVANDYLQGKIALGAFVGPLK